MNINARNSVFRKTEKGKILSIRFNPISVTIRGIFIAAGILSLIGSVSAAKSPPSFTCTGGTIPTGNYSSITVTGSCSVLDNAIITVTGNINVAAGAILDAQSAPSTITVGKNVTAATGALLELGCQPMSFFNNSAHPCQIDPEGHSIITVNGNVTATGANTVLLNGITVGKNVTLTGGGGDLPWAIKNNMISGNLTASEVTATWFGALFNVIGGNATGQCAGLVGT